MRLDPAFPSQRRDAVGLAIPTLIALACLVAGVNDRSAAVAAAHEAPGLRAFGIFVSQFGLSGYMLVISAAVAAGAVLVLRRAERPRTALMARHVAERAVFFFAAIAASGLICQTIKHLVGRPRPRFLEVFGPFHIAGPTFRSGFESFPSGHSTTAFAAAVALSLLRPAWAVVFYPAAVLICVSRIFAEAHYPSDTIAGALLGTVVTLWVARTFAARDVAFAVSGPLPRPSARALQGFIAAVALRAGGSWITPPRSIPLPAALPRRESSTQTAGMPDVVRTDPSSLVLQAGDPVLSVVVPIHNEIANVAPLIAEIEAALAGRVAFEVVYVDDGSTDGSGEELARLRADRPWLRQVRHAQSCGQSAAIRTGVRAARAPAVVTLDGDGQNDPAFIPALYDRLRESGCGLVQGQRVGRKDTGSKKLQSRIANAVRGAILQDGTRDTGCGLKCFRRDVYLALPYFDALHRFMPALVRRESHTVELVDVVDRPRLTGVSNYGLFDRLWVGIVDLFGVRWLIRRRRRVPQSREI